MTRWHMAVCFTSGRGCESLLYCSPRLDLTEWIGLVPKLSGTLLSDVTISFWICYPPKNVRAGRGGGSFG